MTDAKDLLEAVRADTPTEDNRLVPEIAAGRTPLPVLGALGVEEQLIVGSDRRSFLLLASRTDEPNAAGFFTSLGQGESVALSHLPPFIAATGMDADAVAAYQPRPGCQAYPSYIAWLALNAEPAAILLTLMVNFAAWGGYCATVAAALREKYGFADDACAFFDFFASPVPELEAQALAGIQAALDAGGRPGDAARRYARLLQSYEISFWNSLADAESA